MGMMCLFALFFHAKATPFPIICKEDTVKLIIMISVELLIASVLLNIGKGHSKLSSKKAVLLTLLIYVIIQIAFIMLFPLKQNLKSDAEKIVHYAKEILHGNYSSFSIKHYLNYYPNNIGITLFFVFLFKFLPKSIMTIRFCNVIFTTTTAWLIYKLYKEVNPEEDSNSYGILIFSVTFLPAVLMNNLTYGDVISTTFCTGALLCAIRFVKTNKTYFAIYTAVFLMIGNFIRQVTLLFFMAILIYWFVKNIIEQKIAWQRTAVGIVVTIILFNLPLQIFNMIATEHGILQDPIGKHAAPALRWIDIGFANSNNLGYWDKGRDSYIFLHVFNSNPKKASGFFIKDIKHKYSKAGLPKVIEGYAKKTFWMWTEGTYMVNNYALMTQKGNPHFYIYNTPGIKEVAVKNAPMRTTLDELLHSYNLLMMALLVFYLIYAVKKKDYAFELFVILIMLYFCFYLIWEIKSRYLFGLYPIFIIISFKGLCLACKSINSLLTEYINSAFRYLVE
jgi:hypothetical protein